MTAGFADAVQKAATRAYARFACSATRSSRPLTAATPTSILVKPTSLIATWPAFPPKRTSVRIRW